MSTNKWFFEADYIQGCNCDYGCPCEFEAPPTLGFCEGVGAWRIRQGKYNQLALDGLGLAFAIRWPKAIHQGNGTGIFFIDRQATQAQRDALLEIGSGKAGGMPFEIIVTTLSKILDPIYAAFDFKIDGRNSHVKIEHHFELSVEPIRNPVSGEPESVAVEHGTGFIFKRAEAVSTRVCKSEIPGLAFSWPSKAGFVTQVRYGNH